MRNIIVIFEATDEHMEGLALAFGLGAVQRHATIRLRHLNPAPENRLAHQSYGTLQADDLRWAEGIALFLEGEQRQGFDSLAEAFAAIREEAEGPKRQVYLFAERVGPEVVEAVIALLPKNMRRMADDPSEGPATQEHLTRMGQRFADEA